MTVRCEWMGADYTAVRPLIRGDFASDNQEVDESDLAVEVAVDEGVVFTGSREQLINLGSRIIEAAITAHARANNEQVQKSEALSTVLDAAGSWRDELTTYIIPADESYGEDLEETAEGHRNQADEIAAAIKILS